jgi:protein-disulfide isomerase
VLPQVYEEYVRKGKVELIFLDLPLQMHSRALEAAKAAACAGEQQMFWDMHHQLFANQRALAPDDLAIYAKELGLDLAAFQSCLASNRLLAGIREDVRTVNSLGVAGTPAFLLGRRVPGGDKVEVLDIVKGLPPYAVLKEKLEALLAAEAPGRPPERQ